MRCEKRRNNKYCLIKQFLYYFNYIYILLPIYFILTYVAKGKKIKIKFHFLCPISLLIIIQGVPNLTSQPLIADS